MSRNLWLSQPEAAAFSIHAQTALQSLLDYLWVRERCWPLTQLHRPRCSLCISPSHSELHVCCTTPLMLPRASDRKPPPREAFCREHRGGCKAAAGTALAHGARQGAVPRRYQYPALPWHKTLLHTVQSPWVPLWAIQTQDQKKSLEKPYKRTEIYETSDRLTQKPQDAHAGSSDWNFKYKVYHLPYTRQCSLFSIKI